MIQAPELNPEPKPRSKALMRAIDTAIIVSLLVVMTFVLLPMGWMIITAFKIKGTAFRLSLIPQTQIYIPAKDSDGLKFVVNDGSEKIPELVNAGIDNFVVKQVDSDWEISFVTDPGLEFSFVVDDGQGIGFEEEEEGVYTTGKISLKDAGSFRLLQSRSFGEAFGTMYTLENFTKILSSEEFQFGRYFLNSLIVATLAGLLTVLICTMAGYAFAVKQFHFREPLFKLILAAMLVPGMIYMVPQFAIVLKLGWMNSYHGMIVPHLANIFGLFLLRQYISQIPTDLFAAAEIDGASDLQVFQNIVIPVCMPIMVTLFLLTFVGQWSNFLWQLIVNTGDSPFITLPVGLQQFKGQNANDWEMIMAGACFSIIPIAILFVSLQKYFLEGLTAGSMKE